MAATTARATVDIRAHRHDVWRALTDPEKIREYYLGADVVTDWQVGHPITFQGEWNGQRYEDRGRILIFDEDHELAYSHWSPMGGTPDLPENYHVVDVTLDEHEDVTTVTLEQSNLSGDITDDDRAHRDDFERNWRMMLEGLKATVEQ